MDVELSRADLLTQARIASWLEGHEEKGARRVRTPEGMRLFGQPVGSLGDKFGVTPEVVMHAQQRRIDRYRPGKSEESGIETKLRKVRSREGARRYGVPIGTPIVGGKPRPDLLDKAKGPARRQHDEAPSKIKGKVFHPKTTEEAVRLLHEGKRIEFEQPDEVSTLLGKLKEIVDDAVEKYGKDSDKVPKYDLCKVSVRGTNLFCAETKGVPRKKMPQLAGVPAKGSRADKLPRREGSDEVDTSAEFLKALKAKGVKTRKRKKQASHMRASQMELNGGKVAGITQAIRDGKLKPGDVFVSRDGYIVDGHHRWAANVAYDLENDPEGKLGDVEMHVVEVDMNILELLAAANNFSKSWGIGQEGL